ncbi:MULTISPECIES: hypothetical protein [unclassified Streptomyces]|uniref:hypothetical protein n=1 Tax=unclassified Streptomyces TaxID=2593676 RepID=UPI002E2DA19E|nr:hypothetical protein [Streptomyces sp. NBC_01423]WSX95712.1 hypothetical protein OH827_34455 [Streptomyces sp. NBC_00891]WSY10192.1 hypothetical protein OG464_34460 [Streptomyces sp. NBC_00890]WSZ11674.1 hypothetical protein OG704_33725 [Streptomyces sp. NBC_00869]WSZ27920.1 hypothetical protein OG498_34460 [Streptomyces sp. NBC_00870]
MAYRSVGDLSQRRCICLIRSQRLLIADDPWADQFPRDNWNLRLLDLANEDCCRPHFGGIGQPWLRDLTKQWARWRPTRGSNPAGLTLSVQAVTRLACHFAHVDGVDAGPAALNRARIKNWLAALQTDGHSPRCRSRNPFQIRRDFSRRGFLRHRLAASPASTIPPGIASAGPQPRHMRRERAQLVGGLAILRAPEADGSRPKSALRAGSHTAK